MTSTYYRYDYYEDNFGYRTSFYSDIERLYNDHPEMGKMHEKHPTARTYHQVTEFNAPAIDLEVAGMDDWMNSWSAGEIVSTTYFQDCDE